MVYRIWNIITKNFSIAVFEIFRKKVLGQSGVLSQLVKRAEHCTYHLRALHNLVPINCRTNRFKNCVRIRVRNSKTWQKLKNIHASENIDCVNSVLGVFLWDFNT